MYKTIVITIAAILISSCQRDFSYDENPWDQYADVEMVTVDSIVHDPSRTAVWLHFSMDEQYLPDGYKIEQVIGYKNGIGINRLVYQTGYIVDPDAQSGEVNDYYIGFWFLGNGYTKIFGPFRFRVP